MRTVAVWTAFVLAYSSSPLVAGVRYIDPISAQSGNTGDIAEKRVDQNEPTCGELRAVWRYTKRQSRAAKATTGYSLYPDPFSFNLWESYADRPKQPINHREFPSSNEVAFTGRFAGRARNRAGGAPIYGKMVHKAPAGSRFRNGMRHSPRLLDKIPPYYGTINPYPPSSRRRLTSFRTMGGGSPPLSQAPQAGRFLHLQKLLRAERLRELQEQHKADEIAGKASAYGDTTDDELQLNMQQPRKQFLKPALRNPTKMNYEFNQGRYPPNVPNIGQAWSRSGPQSREYMLR